MTSRIPWSSRALWITMFGLTALGGVPRLAHLGHLGFYGDEETSALAARAVERGQGARMPTGMGYRRALPLTWITALSAHTFGPNREFSYRLPAALLGTLTVPLIFLFGLTFFGRLPAFLTATALALSEWHLVFSRMNRMYAPFLFFFLAAAYILWRWSETGDRWRLALGLGLFGISVSLQKLGLMAIFIPMIAVLSQESRRVPSRQLIGITFLMAVVGWAYHRFFVQVPYSQWQLPYTAGGGGNAPLALSAQILPISTSSPALWIAPILGASLGWWGSLRCRQSTGQSVDRWRSVTLHVLGAATGLFASVGQLYGAAVFGLFFVLAHSVEPVSLYRRLCLPLLLAGCVGAVWILTSGFDEGWSKALRGTVLFPFAYPIYLIRAFPGLLGIFGGVCVWLSTVGKRGEDDRLRGMVLMALLPLVAVGLLKPWGPIRYLLPAYPFLLMVSITGLVLGLKRLLGVRSRWKDGAVSVAGLAIVLSGVLGGHGIRPALATVELQYGQRLNPAIHLFQVRPDHQAAGRFLRKIVAQGDVVIAEDVLEQEWYTGKVDYWLRSVADARGFLYVDHDGQKRDIYVGSALIDTPAILDSIVSSSAGRVWLVTSAETVNRQEEFLAPFQRRWLDSLSEATDPLFVGRDGATRVFCVNCMPGSLSRSGS